MRLNPSQNSIQAIISFVMKNRLEINGHRKYKIICIFTKNLPINNLKNKNEPLFLQKRNIPFMDKFFNKKLM